MNDQVAILKEHYNNESYNYDEGYSKPINLGEDLVLANTIKKYLKDSILDAGCGTGMLLEYIIPSELKLYVGIDISEKMLNIAKKKFSSMTFLQNDMHKVSYPNETFDTIVCLYGTFSYSLMPNMLLKEMKRLLKPKGHIVIMPYSLRVKYKILLGYCVKSFSSNLKVNYFSRSFLRIINNEDFTIKEMSGINYFGNIIYPITINLKKIFKFFPTPGFNYLNIEYKVFHFINRITHNAFVNFGRHTLIVAQKNN